MQLYWT